MKIFINRMPVHGPWGGGNRTVIKLVEALENRNHTITYTLNRNDIDILFIFDPRVTHTGIDYKTILNYKKNNNAKIIQRVGDLGFHNKPILQQLLKESLPNADQIIFISDYAKKVCQEWTNIHFTDNDVIYLGPLNNFYIKRNTKMEIDSPVRILTHHWSPNIKKGLSQYLFVDKNLPKYENIKMDFIGQTPNLVRFRNIKHYAPMNTQDLVNILPTYDIYLTGSVQETGGNHVLEAMAAGLPVIYDTNGGGIVDYCKEYGLEYKNENEIFKMIFVMINNYDHFKRKVLTYTYSLEDMINKYIEIIEDVYDKKINNNYTEL